MPADFAAVFQASTSSPMRAASYSGDPPFGSTPTLIKLDFISGVARAALISVFNLVTMSAGVPAGANNPAQISSASVTKTSFLESGHVRGGSGGLFTAHAECDAVPLLDEWC